ncbi:protein of unknown function [Candidatus Nitrosocosmicus franklandus]|uniref:Uncharacterized protein n=1 Tax=Candidatus Nitrosocosmicus franklandianus TaxID=1798806 RepID=A0A484IDL7_9ARCH|nr:protein of unknown function [Candidatus Nitrosocosmicus franklandus]
MGSNPTRSILIAVLKYSFYNNNRDLRVTGSALTDCLLDKDPYG